VFSPPAVAGDHVFAASCSGSLFDLERKTGEFGWVYDTRQDGGRTEFHGTSIVTEDSIVIATDDRRPEGIGHVYVFDRQTGEPRWKKRFDVGVMTDLVLADDVLYFATLRERVVALNISDGELLWTFDAGSATERFFATSTPLVTEEQLIFGGIDGTIHALDRKTGKRTWKSSLGARISTALIDIDGKILAGTADNQLHLLQASDGKTVASRDLPGLPFGRPLETGDHIVVLMTGGSVLSVDKKLGAAHWEAKIDSEWASFRPLLVGGTILAGADDGKVFALSAKSGKVDWSQDFNGPVTSLTHVPGERDELYVGTSNGIIFATRLSQ
jgi:outer membrane protein assembly factor BamB